MEPIEPTVFTITYLLIPFSLRSSHYLDKRGDIKRRRMQNFKFIVYFACNTKFQVSLFVYFSRKNHENMIQCCKYIAKFANKLKEKFANK